MRVMILDLQEYPLVEINQAFTSWRKGEKEIPTVKGIIDELTKINFESNKRMKRLSDFGGDWEAYKKYQKGD